MSSKCHACIQSTFSWIYNAERTYIGLIVYNVFKTNFFMSDQLSSDSIFFCWLVFAGYELAFIWQNTRFVCILNLRRQYPNWNLHIFIIVIFLSVIVIDLLMNRFINLWIFCLKCDLLSVYITYTILFNRWNRWLMLFGLWITLQIWCPLSSNCISIIFIMQNKRILVRPSKYSFRT